MGDKFGVDGWNNMPGSNVLEKNRYGAEVISIGKHISSAGNHCIKIVVVAEGIKITDFIVLTDADKKPYLWGKAKWKEFLYAIGIRDNRRTFEIDEDRIVGSKCKIDVTKDKDKNLGEDGITVWKNTIRYYAPILEETAPITGVPGEDEGKAKPETKKDTDIDGL